MSVMSSRGCSRQSCREPAVATLTYVYATSTAVVGPLAVPAEPHTYDLCDVHARSLTAPRGWELVRSGGPLVPPPAGPDDLVALADAVREAAHPHPAAHSRPASGSDPDPDPGSGGPLPPGGRRGHLRVVPPG